MYIYIITYICHNFRVAHTIIFFWCVFPHVEHARV